MQFFFALLCVVPSAWVNANAQVALGAGPDMIAGVLLFALLAPIFTLRCMDGRGLARLGWGLMAAIFIVMNFFISLSGISGVRDTAMDIRAEQQRTHAARQDVLEQIAALRRSNGPAAAAVVKAQMDAEPTTWKREKIKIRWETAKQIERLQAQIDGWGAVLEPAPASVDPGISNIAAISITLFNFRLDERFLAAILSGAFALLLELGADIGPIAIYAGSRTGSGGLGGSVPGVPAKTLKQAVARLAAYPPTRLEPDDLTVFMTGSVETVAGLGVQASVLYRAYVAWAKKHERPVLGQTAFGTTLKGMNIEKVKRGGAWYYTNLRLKQGLWVVT